MSAGNNQTAAHGLVALGVNTAAPVGASAGDVVKTLLAKGVQEGVEETKRSLASAQTGIVQKTDNGGKDGRGSGGTTSKALTTLIDDLVAVGKRSEK